MKPNASVQAELARLRDEWDRGAVEGYETPLTTRPANQLTLRKPPKPLSEARKAQLANQLRNRATASVI